MPKLPIVCYRCPADRGFCGRDPRRRLLTGGGRCGDTQSEPLLVTAANAQDGLEHLSRDANQRHGGTRTLVIGTAAEDIAHEMMSAICFRAVATGAALRGAFVRSLVAISISLLAFPHPIEAGRTGNTYEVVASFKVPGVRWRAPHVTAAANN